MSFTRIDDLIEPKKIKTIGIAGHVRPDGDCTGAALALRQYLIKRYKNMRVDVFLEEMPQIYDFMPGSDEVRTDFKTDVEHYDMFIAVDTEKQRTGDAEKYFDEAGLTVNIDHHVSNHGSAMENYMQPDASSTCELIFDLIDQEYMDESIAKAIYCGIVSDTGVFKYSATTPKTLRTAAELISYGFDFNELIDRTFYRKTFLQNQLLGRVLMEATLFMGGKCIMGVLTRSTMQLYQATNADLDGIASRLMLTTGVVCAVFLHETDSMVFKASLRSNGMVDVSKIAELFGGGGHVRAAGCNMNGTSHDCVNNIARYIEEQLEGIG